MTKSIFDSALNDALGMYATGHDNKYITLQLAEQGVSDNIIDAVIKEIERVQKEKRKRQGIKSLIFGASIIVVCVLFALILSRSGSPVVYIMWSLATFGVLLMGKGIMAFVGL